MMALWLNSVTYDMLQLAVGRVPRITLLVKLCDRTNPYKYVGAPAFFGGGGEDWTMRRSIQLFLAARAAYRRVGLDEE
jgi:hypothetical protein